MSAARDGEQAVRAKDPGGAINALRALAGHPASSRREARSWSLDTHASAGIHIDASLEHRLGMVVKDSGALTHCYDDSGCAGLARGGGETGQPAPRDADSAGHLLEPHSVAQACDSESGGGGPERGQDVWLGTGERGLGISALVPGAEMLGGGHPSQSIAADGAAATDSRHPGSHPSRDALPLPRHEEARGGDGGRDG